MVRPPMTIFPFALSPFSATIPAHDAQCTGLCQPTKHEPKAPSPLTPPFPASHWFAGLSCNARLRGDFDPRPAGRDFGSVHELFDRFFHRWPGVGGDSGQHGHAALRPGRQTWRQLYADDGGVGCRVVWDGGAGPGDGVVGTAGAADVEAGSISYVDRDVRCGGGDALHAAAGGSHAIALSVGIRGG